MKTALAVLGGITLACTVAMTIIVWHFAYTDRRRREKRHADVDALAARDRLNARRARVEQWHDVPERSEWGIGG